LVSLDEHNSEAWATQTGWFSNEPKPNGIACSECGEELMDSNPNETLTSYPAQKNVHCPKCGTRGYRIA
jgi:DNA-directed RNA polymerase subunit RPC12/RpoP